MGGKASSRHLYPHPNEIEFLRSVDKATFELAADHKKFAQTLEGQKTHEVSRFDRRFEVGDLVLLRETNPKHRPQFTGRWILIEITYITRPRNEGLQGPYGVFSFKKLRAGDLKDKSS